MSANGCNPPNAPYPTPPMDDYAVVSTAGKKVSAMCGFSSFDPTSFEEGEAEELAGTPAQVAMVNPHHPRFVPGSHVYTAATVGSAAAADAAPPVEDERDYGSEDSAVEEADGKAAASAPPTRAALAPYETLAQQVDRMKALRSSPSTAQYADAIMLQGQRLVDLATKGDTIRVMELVLGSEEGELLYWHTTKMFLVACEHAHVDVVKFMILQGFDVGSKAVVDAVHVAVGSRRGHATLDTINVLASSGMDVNRQRSSDWWSPLHVASANGAVEAVELLLSLGADPSAVAKEDATPLSIVLHALATGGQSDEATEALTRIRERLCAAGASATWRSAVPEPPAEEAAASDGGAGTGRSCTNTVVGTGRRPGLDFSTE